MNKKKLKDYSVSKIHPKAEVTYKYHKLFGYIRTAKIDGII